MKPAKQLPIRLSAQESLEQAISNLPIQTYLGASRYDTDNETVLHLWDSGGKSYDLRFPKKTRIAKSPGVL